MTDLKNSGSEFLERRRQLLKLGAAGVPMVLTLNASAAEAIHSALDCAFVIPSKIRILVDWNGQAWVGSSDIKYKNGKGYKVADIEYFKQNADYVFPAGSVPSQYVPDECPPEPEPTCGGDDDDDWGQSFGTMMGSAGGDQLQESIMVADWGGDDDDDCNNNDDDDDDDGSGGSKWIDCGYNFFTISKNTTITPSDYLSNNGTWNLSGTNGLYLALAHTYLNTYGNDGGFPGISCLLSILNYLEIQQ